jgi:hypothetical protein
VMMVTFRLPAPRSMPIKNATIALCQVMAVAFALPWTTYNWTPS